MSVSHLFNGSLSDKTKKLTIQQKAFFDSDNARLARVELKAMENNPEYNTRKTFSSSQPEDVSFIDKHLLYLSTHPNVSVKHYLSNLRIMTRKK